MLDLLCLMFDNLLMSKKESLREQIAKAKENFSKILSKEKVSPELQATITSVMKIMNVVLLVLLEKKVRKNSSNSGLPPSHDFGARNDRNKEGEQEEKKRGEQLDNSKTVEEHKTLSPDKCSKCDTPLDQAKVTAREDRKSIDIEYVIKETIYTSETKKCSECGEETKAEYPEGIDGPEQYGIGIKAAIINFLMVQMISLQRVQEHFKGLVGRFISQAVMLKYISQLGHSLKKWEEEKIRELLKSPVFHVDETGMRVEKKNWWIHVYSVGDIVLLFLHPKRGSCAMEDIGILPKYAGTIIHDCLPAYFKYKGVTHALCIAHLLRELKLVEESTVDKWATRLKILLKTAVRMVTESEDKILTEEQYAKLQRLYREILKQGEAQLPPFPESGDRGRPKHTDAQNLWLRLKKHQDSVLMFAKVKEVDPTNNRAERDLRMSKVKKKVSGCFRSREYAEHFCRISSYVKTMRNKGYSSLQAITIALKGEIPT